jgi:hypothetical protein
MDEDYYVIPDEWPMEIKTPSGKTVTVNFKPQSSTIIRSSDIGILFDGIYCFKTESCGHDYTRNEAIICSLECKMDTLISMVDASNENKELLEKAKGLNILIESIKTNAHNGKIEKALRTFKIVSKELENIDCI